MTRRWTCGPLRLPRPLLLAVLAALAAACDGNGARADQEEYVSPIAFDTVTARVITATDTFTLRVEVAEREFQRSYGLMERTSLPANAGMIFLYDTEQPEGAGFWMYRTRIPLDIAYLDRDGVIVDVQSMDPCPDVDPRACPSYPSRAAYFSALEVNRGWFARHGVGVGDRVVLVR